MPTKEEYDEYIVMLEEEVSNISHLISYDDNDLGSNNLEMLTSIYQGNCKYKSKWFDYLTFIMRDVKKFYPDISLTKSAMLASVIYEKKLNIIIDNRTLSITPSLRDEYHYRYEKQNKK